MRQSRRYRAYILSSCAMAALVISVGSQAKAAEMPANATASATATSMASDQIEDIVVTATRRREKMQKVGISVTAFSGDQLANLGISQTSDIIAQVPGLKFNQFNPSVTVFNIRGVSQNDFGDQLEPPVAVYIDDAYIATMGGVGVPAFDLQRVEVLRGPQGTQFGRNATGGAIQYISNRPTKDFEGYVDVTGGTGKNLHAEGAISGPLGEKAQARLAGTYNGRDGYVKNDAGSDIGAENNYAFRGQLALQPSENLNILLLGRYSKNSETGAGYSAMPAYFNADGLGVPIGPNDNPWGTCNGCDALGHKPNSDPLKASDDQVGRFNREIWETQGRFELTLGDISISSLTDYQHMGKHLGEDTDGGPFPFLQSYYDQAFHQFSEEFKVSGKTGNLRWLTGFYYLDWASNQSDYLTSKTYFGTPDEPFISGYTGTYHTRSWSIFGQAEYAVTSKLTAILGARYVQDRKTADYSFADNVGDSLIFNTALYPDAAREKFNDYALRAGLNYNVTEDTLLYASFNRGVKGPNFSAPTLAPVSLDTIPYKGETLYSYEAGLKSTFADRRLRVNLSGFIYNYKNYQAFIFANVSNTVVNRDATAKGLELEVTALPTAGLHINGGISLMTSKVKGVTLPSGRLINPALPQAPGFSGNFLIRYERPVTEGLMASAQFDMSYTGASYFTVLQAPVDHEGAYSVGNARIGISDQDARWEIAAFVKNLWDTRYRVYSADVGTIGFYDSVYAEPRWYGVQIRYKFGKSS